MAKYKTAQRKLMQELFANNPHEMFSAEKIASMLDGKSVSISAIYRNLSELENSNIIRRCSKTGSRKSFYQYNGAEDCKGHIHLRCTKCGKTIHMESSDTEALVMSALKYKNFAVDKTDTILYGICGACRNI